MSQEAKTRALIDDAVARATAPLIARVEALEARLTAPQESGGTPAATEPKRASTGRSRTRTTREGDNPTTAAK